MVNFQPILSTIFIILREAPDWTTKVGFSKNDGMWRSQKDLYLVSGPAGYHPQALSEPDLNLSIHPASAVQSHRILPLSSVQIDEAPCEQELVRRWMVARFQIRTVASCKKKKEDLFLKGDEVSSLLIFKKRASRFWIKFRMTRCDVFEITSVVIPVMTSQSPLSCHPELVSRSVLWRQLQRMKI